LEVVKVTSLNRPKKRRMPIQDCDLDNRGIQEEEKNDAKVVTSKNLFSNPFLIS
jgi:hypothetical protein